MDMTDHPSGMPQPAAEPADLRFYGTVQPTANFQVTLPAVARRELQLDAHEPLFVFGSPLQRRAILTASPPPDELLAIIGERHAAKPAGPEPKPGRRERAKARAPS